MSIYREPDEHRRLRTLGVECMRGGHILAAAPHSINDAEALGAVRVLLQASPGSLGCTIPFVLPFENRAVVAAMLDEIRDEVPDVFVVRDANTPVDGLPSFVQIDAIKDLESAILHRPYVLISSCPDVARQLKKQLPPKHANIPVYVSVDSLQSAYEAFSVPPAPDGLLLSKIPSEKEMHELYRRQAEATPIFPKSAAFTIGVLAHQGDYQLHIDALRDLLPPHMRVLPVGTSDAIRTQVDALVLPGGWSTVQGTMMQVTGVDDAIKEINSTPAPKPILAVCAGMILARQSDGEACDNRIHLDLLPVTIDNNVLNGVYDVTRFGSRKIFSNGPIARPLDDQTNAEIDEWPVDLRVLSRIAAGIHKGKAVAVKSRNCLGFAFHEDIHGPFLDHCEHFV